MAESTGHAFINEGGKDLLVIYWKGRRVDDLSRQELIDAISWQMTEISRLRSKTEAMRPHVDWTGYLLAKKGS